MRADFVGSFLRPVEVKEARVAFAEGRIVGEELKAVRRRIKIPASLAGIGERGPA